MSTKYRKKFDITGVINVTTPDEGIVSSEAEPKRITAVVMNVSGYADNVIEFWRETEKLSEIYDKLVCTEASSGSTNVQYDTAKEQRFEVDLELPIGETFLVAMLCGGTAKNVHGFYEYERIS